MSIRRNFLKLFLSAIMGIVSFGSHAVEADQSVTLYTPYTKISVPPGESINYSIEVINNSKEIKNEEITVSRMPRGWTYILKSGSWNIKQLSILPGEKKTLSLKVQVPLKVNKGNYHFNVLANGMASLPLAVNVSKQGTFKTEFTTDQSNMEGNSKSSFTFKANLKNGTDDKQVFALESNAPRGWDVAFKANYKQVASVNVDENSAKDITIEIKPPSQVKAGKYKIPIRAVTGNTTATLELEVVVTGSYSMELTTPTGLLSTHITAGDEKKIELVVRNTGSSVLEGIKISSSKPLNWDITFEPKQIERLEPGKSEEVYATIKAAKKAIAGDYVTTINAKTPEASSKAEFRVSVKTSMIMGWIGIFIIFAALGSVIYLFRKYGRR